MELRELNSELSEDEPKSRGSVVVFRGFIGVLLLAFAGLVGLLIFRGQTRPQSLQPQTQSQTPTQTPPQPTLPATEIALPGFEVPPLVSAQEVERLLLLTPPPEVSQLIEAVPVISDAVAVSTAITVPATLAVFEAKPLTTAPVGQPNPYYGPNYNPNGGSAGNDGKPIYVCATDSFASYLLLVQMQTSGLDVANGFHLGIVPYSINDQEYEISQANAENYLKSGEWDCDMGTLDTVARTDYGVVTAVIDERVGGDGIYARGMNSIYDLKGKRLGYMKDGPAELFARYVVQVAQLTTSTVSFVPFNNINDAVAAFDAGQIDALSGWGSYLQGRASTGGAPLVTSEQLRVILDVVVTSKASIQNKPQVVQRFHDAWFSTLKAQLENYDHSADLIAAWGHNDWLSISKEHAGADLRTQMQAIAQADLRDNVSLMANLAPIYNQVDIDRRIWAEAGPLAAINAQALVDPQFVLASAAKPELQTTAQPLNNTFSLGASANPSATNAQTTLVVLPCKRFNFLPDKIDLSPESGNAVNLCVLRALQQRPGTRLKIMGSAAWPGPAGTYSETRVLQFAKQRAQAMANYLVAQGIDRTRLAVEGTLPPADHRQTLDAAKQAEDRFVEMTLVTAGL